MIYPKHEEILGIYFNSHFIDILRFYAEAAHAPYTAIGQNET
jgi:hypothetical protein